MSKAEQLAELLEAHFEGYSVGETLHDKAAALLRAQDALLRQALEALEHCCFASNDGTITDKDVAADAIYAIKEHLK